MAHRLQAKRFLALGALAQAPGNVMKLTAFRRYILDVVREIDPDQMVRGLVRDRLAMIDSAHDLIGLTDDGASAQRIKGVRRCPHFIRVPDDYLK